MYIRPKITWRKLIRDLWPATLVVVAYSILVSWLDISFHLEQLQIPVGLAVLPGTLIGILLAFRTSAAYDRWWEARILWGRIVNDSRSWVRQLLTFVEPDDSQTESANRLVTEMGHRQAAWCYALTRALRGQPPLQDVDSLLPSTERESLALSQNVPNDILLNQGKAIANLHQREWIDAYQRVELERSLTRLTDNMGGCERIRNTPFPPQYGLWVHYLVYLFILALPLALVEVPPIGLLMISVPMAMIFLITDQVAIYLETPFALIPSGTPMLALSRTIEINIREMLGEEELPDPVEPIGYVLY